MYDLHLLHRNHADVVAAARRCTVGAGAAAATAHGTARAAAAHAWPTAPMPVAKRAARTTKRHEQRPEEVSDR